MSLEWVEKAIASDNIAKLLDDEQLVEIAADVEKGYKEDKMSRAEWEEKQSEYMKLALQVREVKNTPWPNASNVKYPLLTTATMQFGARAYPSLISSPSIVKGRVTGFDSTGEKAKSAERVGKHMSYQLIEEMDNWEEDMDKLSVSLPIVGCMFKKVYFSPSKQKNVSELVYPAKLVVNYWAKHLRTAPRITHELDLTDNEIYERVASKLFLDQEYEKTPIKGDDTSDAIHGTTPPPEGDTTPHESYEQHTWIDLDDDGYKEPYIVTVVDRKVARIMACFDEDSVTVLGERVVRIEKIEYFTKYGFVPNPDGSFYDVGFGLLLGPINETINTSINQLNDAGTLSNGSRGFLGRGVRLKAGDKTFKLNEWKQTMSTGDDLRKGIVELPTREPSGTLFNLLGLMIEAGKELSSTVPMLMGQNPGQNQPATTSMSVVEQGLKVFSAIFKRMHRSLHGELKLLKRLNKLYLPPEAYFMVLDEKAGNQGDPSKIFQQDYSDDVTDVQPYSDPNIVSDTQRMIKAQQVNEMLAQQILPNPTEGARVVLEAMDLPEIDKLLTPPEPQPDPEVEMKKAEFEHKKQLEISRLQLDEQRLALDTKIYESNRVKDETIGMLNIAKAEAADAKSDNDDYRAEIEELKVHLQREKDANEARANGRMAGEPGN